MSFSRSGKSATSRASPSLLSLSSRALTTNRGCKTNSAAAAAIRQTSVVLHLPQPTTQHQIVGSRVIANARSFIAMLVVYPWCCLTLTSPRKCLLPRFPVSHSFLLPSIPQRTVLVNCRMSLVGRAFGANCPPMGIQWGNLTKPLQMFTAAPGMSIMPLSLPVCAALPRPPLSYFRLRPTLFMRYSTAPPTLQGDSSAQRKSAPAKSRE